MTLFVPVKEGRVIDTRASLEAEANPGYSLVAQPTPVRRLDAWRLDDVAVIKIDVEGHEAAVLAGARETILRNRPALVVEIEERHHPGRSSSIVDDLVANGYRAHYIEGGEVVGADVIDFVRLQPPALAKSPDGAFDSGYVNNFLFLPREGRTQVL
ncbi:hypothetical protein GCM10007036_18510 [Alsobacter metallidurans]|uniref:Methyltransferase FkbM domain-containing protein n=2 Tax=Alsobacter metallidurans TaxID=340221 RepID=A0A917MHJ4_9HYPH|nr:hypothetical protein GCM10007036_18510 [Alsobacter metallidurans]